MEESKSLIPDPSPSDAPNEDALPTASIIPSEEDQSLVPADPNPLNDNGSLVPDSDVVESGEHAPETKKEEIPTTSPAKEDDSYRVPPEPTNDIPVAGAIKEETKTKKPLNVKKLAIIGGSILAAVAVVLVAIFVVVPLIEKNSRTSLDNTIKSALIREKSDEDGKYAVFDTDNGKQLTDFIFSTATDFSDGYALVSDSEGANSGIVSSGGAMSVEFGKYSTIKKTDAVYEVTNDDGLHRLIKGNGDNIANISDKIEYHESDHFAILKSDDKYYVIDTNTGDKKYEYESGDKPTYSHDSLTNYYNIISKKRVLIFADGSLEPIVDQETEQQYEVDLHSKNYGCLVLKAKSGGRNYIITYNGKTKEIVTDYNLRLRDYVSAYKDKVVVGKSCYIYSDPISSYGSAYHGDHRILNDSFEFINRPYNKTADNELVVLDADHMLIYAKNSTNDYDVEFYVKGALVGRAVSRYAPDIVDDSFYRLSSIDEGYKSTYYLYSADGKMIEKSTEHNYTSLDEFGNRILTSNIYTKDYKILTPNIPAYDLTNFRGHYLYKESNSSSINLVDPSTGKIMLAEGVYRSIVYNEDNNVYIGERVDGATDILDDKFESIVNITGKLEMRKNYYMVSGASTTELFNLKGEKFYAYE